MPRLASRIVALLALPLGVAPLFAACSDAASPTGSASSAASGTTTATTTATSGTGGSGGSGGAGGQGGTGGMAPDPSALCKDQGLPIRPFAEGPYGTHRGELADDFTLDLYDGTSFHLKDQWSGCESYVFIPDRLPVSELDPTSVWAADKDLNALVKASPKNVHYFFVSRLTTDAMAEDSLKAQQGRVDLVVSKLGADADHWKARLHVVKKRAQTLGGWVQKVFDTHGKIGFSIDRLQRVRGAGHLADVKRFSSALNSAMKWPWKSNLAYAAHDPAYFNAQSLLQDRIDAEGATIVKLWDGETLAEKADTMAALPSAAEMANFDTLEVEVTQQCPDPEQIELGNCGAWDYIANLFLTDDENNPIELARFITSYHRETHWVVDASPMLTLLKSGGDHKFRWSFAPSWNTQPTATKLALRFSKQNKPVKPTQTVYLWGGGSFGAAYNMGRMPVDVPIPQAAKKVELWTIITGHGAGTNQCSEFCNHQHEFSVNGHAYLEQFPNAGSDQSGCISHLDNGMTPNQAGTWWFGRGGWCPGQQVDPWVQDVTADVTPGQTATVSYRGLFKNIDPPPDGSGDIDMVSYLVISE
ncbi:MAG: peptide-N-glycosidase F-related protein [Byssovorax sp.]